MGGNWKSTILNGGSTNSELLSKSVQKYACPLFNRHRWFQMKSLKITQDMSETILKVTVELKLTVHEN